MMSPTKKLIEIGNSPYTLVFNFGMARVAEKEIGEPLATAFGEGKPVTLDAISALFWAALQNKHRMTREAADALIDVAGLPVVAGVITEGLTEYFGASEENEEAEQAPGNGRKRR